MEFCRKRTNGEPKAGDRKVGRKGEKKALRDGVGYGVGISMDSRLRRPGPNTKKSHFSATNFFTCYMRILNDLRIAVTL